MKFKSIVNFNLTQLNKVQLSFIIFKKDFFKRINILEIKLRNNYILIKIKS